MNNDLISRDVLKKALKDAHINKKITFDIATYNCVMNIIDNAPAIEYTFEAAFQKTVCENKLYCPERPLGNCKTCKYYNPYYEQFSSKPRGDGYCVIARMTNEGLTTINCNDEFGCSDYQKGGGK